MRRAGCSIAVLLALAGCGKNNAPASGATGIGGQAAAGASGTGGVAASGTGGASSVPGTGGAGAPVAGCEAADATMTGSAAHAAALSVLNQMVPCGLSVCHAGAGQAKLVLFGVTDLKATLVDKASCEAAPMPLVSSHGGNAALMSSWLWQKLTAPAMSTDALIVQSPWGTAGVCPTMGFGKTQTSGFGDRMPYGSLATLEQAPLASIRNWICAGAPGP
jgi:hypothetical protein